MTGPPTFLYDGCMTSTANNPQQNPPAEAPLAWSRSKVRGSVGLTHDADTEINGEKWVFRVDSPSKGLWVARAWRDGDFALYREDRTMKGAKQQAQEHANYAATSTCTECRKIGGHSEPCIDCQPQGVQEEGANVATPLELGPDVLKRLDPAEAQQLMAELEETFPHLAEWKRDVLDDRMSQAGEQSGPVTDAMAGLAPVVVDADESFRRMTAAIERVQAARDRVQFRKDTCGCRTPLHTMRCGVGGRARVICSAVSL